MSKTPRISEAEWEVMKVLWKKSPQTANDVVKVLSLKTRWKRETIRTLINRLVQKKAVSFEKKGRQYHYFARVGETECVREETETFLKRFHGGSVEPMLADFVKAKKLARQIIMVTHDANLVVLTDAENVIVSNQAGQQADRENEEHRFEYVTGALEHSFRRPQTQAPGVLFSCGIREHVCDILEGGEEAFRKREQRYGFSHR